MSNQLTRLGNLSKMGNCAGGLIYGYEGHMLFKWSGDQGRLSYKNENHSLTRKSEDYFKENVGI